MSDFNFESSTTCRIFIKIGGKRIKFPTVSNLGLNGLHPSSPVHTDWLESTVAYFFYQGQVVLVRGQGLFSEFGEGSWPFSWGKNYARFSQFGEKIAQNFSIWVKNSAAF